MTRRPLSSVVSVNLTCGIRDAGCWASASPEAKIKRTGFTFHNCGTLTQAGMPVLHAIQIVPATEADTPVILEMIRALAEYEKLLHVVTATEEKLRRSLFGRQPVGEVLLAHYEGECAGFALFFP